MTPETLHAKRVFCRACGEPAFSADGKGPRRYAPAEFIKRHLRGVFDLLVADEVHELKGEDTGQGNAFGALASACRRTLALTGTLLGGYADNIFHFLWRSHPGAMAAGGLEYRGVQQWMERYGVLERITRVRLDETAEDARTVRGKRRARTLVRRKPAVSPLVLGRHLLRTTLFLRLADVAGGLPPYEKRVVSLAMSPELAEAYGGLEPALTQAVREALDQGSRHLLAAYLQALLCYPDAATIRGEVVVDPRTQETLGATPQLHGPLTETAEQIGTKLLLVDFIERVSPSRQRARRVRVQPAALDSLLRTKPTPGQLALF